MRRAAAVAVLIVAGVRSVGAQGDVDSLAARVHRLADAYVAGYFERHPDEATLDGVAGVRHDRLPDNSPITRGRWQAREDRWLAELRRIDPAPLAGRPEWTAYGVMRGSLEGAVAIRPCHYQLWNVSHVNQGWLPIVTSLAAVQPVGSDELRAQALARWQAIPLYIASEMANQREGLRLGYSAPQSNVRIVIKQLDQLLDERLDRSPLYAPALRDSTPAFRDELRRFIENAILPTIRQYRQFLDKEYLPRARKPIGVSANPNGAACYKGAILATTGLTLSPDSIHRLRRAAGFQAGAGERGHTQADLGAAAIPAMARYFWSPGFGEGWAEYAEQLADEMGVYSSDTARLGALADLTLSAALLVVDTGINAFGWTRDDGIQFLEAHTRVPQIRAEVPVDRYPMWPAQGLSYALGRLEIRRLRALAEQTLGAKFDIQTFHDRVLEDGAVPLPLLRDKIERWLTAPR